MWPPECAAPLLQFDKVLDGEPARPVDARKRRRTAVERTEGEHKRDFDVLRKVLGGSAYGLVEMPTQSAAAAPATTGRGRGGKSKGKQGGGSTGKKGGKKARKGGKGGKGGKGNKQ